MTIPVGMNRDQLVPELREHAYCASAAAPDPHTREETFPRCDQPGVEYSQSWVVAAYDESGHVIRLDRWEKYSDPDKLQDRFNDLIDKRTKLAGPPTDNAKALVLAQRQLPPGTKTWVAFESGDYALVGIYLLDPKPPAYASLLEEVLAR